MALEISAIRNKGRQDEEYVELRATEACDLRFYIVADTTYTSEASVSNMLRHTYWFTSYQVAKGDYVFLYTGRGSHVTFANKAGTVTHVFFWGLGSAVWNDTGDGGVLFNIRQWSTKRA